MLLTSLPRCVIALGVGHCTVAQLCRYGKLSILVESGIGARRKVNRISLEKGIPIKPWKYNPTKTRRC
jgi:hypothetical protein